MKKKTLEQCAKSLEKNLRDLAMLMDGPKGTMALRSKLQPRPFRHWMSILEALPASVKNCSECQGIHAFEFMILAAIYQRKTDVAEAKELQACKTIDKTRGRR